MESILSDKYQEQLVEGVLGIFKDTVKSLVNSETTKQRYIRQKNLPEYAFGVDQKTIKKWEAKGLTPIVIDGVVGYDRFEVDEFIIKHKFLKK